MSAEEIQLAAHYDGVRIRCRANLGSARIPIHIDIGFGDVITPGALAVVYPTLLDFDAPRLLGYTPETSIAEKFQAMVVLDMANTRLKDFLDLWVLSQGREFRGEVVAEAIEATFLRRRTQVPKSTPVALTAAFHSASAKQTQWRAYLRKNRIEGEVPPLDEVTNQIQAFVMPAVDALVDGRPFAKRWSPGGPWQDERIE